MLLIIMIMSHSHYFQRHRVGAYVELINFLLILFCLQFELGRGGACGEGEEIGDVVLPPWASSLHEFVHMHREARPLHTKSLMKTKPDPHNLLVSGSGERVCLWKPPPMDWLDFRLQAERWVLQPLPFSLGGRPIRSSSSAGAEAVKAKNLFYHLTYIGSVDLDAIEEPALRKVKRTST